jgi:hypothetical protein
MSATVHNRNLLRLAALVLTATASVLFVSVGGPFAYVVAAVAAMLLAIVLGTAQRESLRSFGALFRVELLLGGAAIVGMFVPAFLTISPEQDRVLVLIVVVLSTTYFLLLAVKTFRILRAAAREPKAR